MQIHLFAEWRPGNKSIFAAAVPLPDIPPFSENIPAEERSCDSASSRFPAINMPHLAQKEK